MTGSATGVGAMIGVVISLVIIAVLTLDPLDGMASQSRPEGVPAEALWSDHAFGQPGWVLCTPGAKGVDCQAFGRSGQEVFAGTYVPRDGGAPAAPITEIVATDVERVWLNKVAMVPTGEVRFPHAGLRATYNAGRRLTAPGP